MYNAINSNIIFLSFLFILVLILRNYLLKYIFYFAVQSWHLLVSKSFNFYFFFQFLYRLTYGNVQINDVDFHDCRSPASKLQASQLFESISLVGWISLFDIYWSKFQFTKFNTKNLDIFLKWKKIMNDKK